MRLAEYDGKALLRRHGVAVPRGVLVHAGESPPDAVADWPGFVLKAQLLEGGRGKRGLVRVFDKLDGFRDARRLILPALEDANIPLLLEEAVPIAREIFIAVRIDGSAQRLELLVAPEGGENVEATAKLARIPIEPDAPTTPEKIFAALRQAVSGRSCRAPGALRRAAAGHRAPRRPGIAGDQSAGADQRRQARSPATPRSSATRPPTSATTRNEFAISRTLAERAMTKLEREAQALGFQLVETDGDVVLVTSGAGLGMMMMDLIGDHGMRAASFMDNLRGAPDETMTERLKIARALAAPAQHQGDHLPDHARLAVARRAHRGADHMACRRAAAETVVCRHRRRPRRRAQNERGAGGRAAAGRGRFGLHRSGGAGEGRGKGGRLIRREGSARRDEGRVEPA